MCIRDRFEPLVVQVQGYQLHDLPIVVRDEDPRRLHPTHLRMYYTCLLYTSRFLPEYCKYSALSQAEVEAFHDLIAVQHFATQATIMGIFGLDCFDNTDMDLSLIHI